jgi:hypothetical protein
VDALSRSVEAAEHYISLGWRIVPISIGAKDPSENGRDWQKKLWPAEACEGRNVGVILGHVSNHLTDIDLDCDEAMALAPSFLPETLTFGHAPSKPQTHWLYYAEGSRSAMMYFGSKASKGLVEIRATNAGGQECGHQSVFPGSMWTSKDGTRTEEIDWDSNAPEPATVDAAELRWAVQRLVMACAILREWAPESGRHEKSKAIAGVLLKAGWTAEEVRHCLASVRAAAGDSPEEEQDFGHDVESTIEAFAAGRLVTAHGALRELDLAEHEFKDFDRYSRSPQAQAGDARLALTNTRAGQAMRGQLAAEARAVDGVLARAEALDETPPEPEGDEPQAPFLAKCRIIDLSRPYVAPPMICTGLGLTFGGKPHLDAGFAGTGKGPLATYRTLCFAAGLPFFGHAVERVPALYIDCETGEALATQRFHRIARAMGLDAAALQAEGWLDFKIFEPPFDPAALQGLDAYMRARGQRALHGDSLTSLNIGKNQNDAEYAELVFELGRLGDALGAFVSITGHSRKDAPASLEAVSGHNAIVAAFESAWLVSRPDEQTSTAIEVACIRSTQDRFETFQYEWRDVGNAGDPKHGLLPFPASRNREVKSSDEISEKGQALLRELVRHGIMGLTLNQLAGGDLGYNHAAMRNDLNRLINDKKIHRSYRGNATLYHPGPDPDDGYNSAERQAAEVKRRTGLETNNES